MRARNFILAALFILAGLTACTTPLNPATPTPVPTSTPTPPPDSNCPRPEVISFTDVTDPRSTFCFDGTVNLAKLTKTENSFSFQVADPPSMWYPHYQEDYLWLPKGWMFEGVMQSEAMQHPAPDYSYYKISRAFGCSTMQNPPLFGPLKIQGHITQGTFTYTPDMSRCQDDSPYGRAEKVRQIGDCPTIAQFADTQRVSILAQSRIDAHVYSQNDAYLPKGWKAVADNGLYGTITEDQDDRTMHGNTGWMIYLPAKCVVR